MRSLSPFLRSTLLFAAFLAVGGGLSLAQGAKPAAADSDPDPVMTAVLKKPKDAAGALTELKNGSSRFAAGMNRSCEFSEGEREALATNGQHPYVAILGDCDARVPVEKVFDMEPGDVYTVRVAGSAATADAQASLEYAVTELHVPLIVVLGNSDDAAVKAAVKGAAPAGSYGKIVETIKPAVAGTTSQPEAVKKNVAAQVAALQANAVLKEVIAAGKLKVTGGVYKLEDGTFQLLAQ